MNNNKELILKSLAHLNVIKLLNQSRKTYEEFIEDKIVLDSTIFHLIQVGELCNKFTKDFKNNHHEIEFRGIIGLRNVMVHGYGTLCYEDIFTIVDEDVKELIKQYKDILIKEYNYKNIDKYIDNYNKNRKFDNTEN